MPLYCAELFLYENLKMQKWKHDTNVYMHVNVIMSALNKLKKLWFEEY